MAPLFSTAGQRRLDEIVKPGLLCVFDFDGTLSPIVTQPDKARLPLGVRRRLTRLAELTPVAIITGRSLADIRSRLDFEPSYVIGNHGLEGVPGWEDRSESYETLCRSWNKTLETAFEDKGRYDDGIQIEDKHYSISVHYRFARDQEKTRVQLLEIFNTLSPPAHVIAGKCVFSLVPCDAADKGSALAQLMQISGAPGAIYIGDDITDEDVFELQQKDLMSIRVGLASDSAAKFFLSHQVDIVQLIDELIRRLRSFQV